MNVVSLFPVLRDEPDAPASASAAQEAVAGPVEKPAGRQRPPTLPARVRRGSSTKAPSPVDILAKAARRPGATRDPATVIARSLDRQPALDSFWQIWMAHQDLLRHRSLRLSGGNRADAEDALGNAMVRAAQAFGRQPVQNPGAWLVRILHNACMDQHRQNANRTPIEDDRAELPAPAAAAWKKAEPSPEEALTQLELAEAWRQAMSALPGALIDPLRLHLDDWTDDMIARHLNISRELVRKRRQLAKDRLRALLNL